MSRHLHLEGVHNLRDFGDYPAGERRLRKGLLFRSAHHAFASEDDLQTLAGLGLATIVDLRRANERAGAPCRRWPGFGAQVIENDLPEESDDEWRDFVVASDLTPPSFDAYAMDYYRTRPFSTRYLDLYARYFRALAAGEGPVLVHCAAGKDRTGMLCALTHHLAGVHPDDIVADYLLTNDETQIGRRLPFMREHIVELTGREATDEALITALSVAPEYLEAAFAAMRDRYGSVDAYLEEALGLDARARDAVLAHVLA